MTKDHYLVGRSERSEVRHEKPDEILCVGLRFAHSDLRTECVTTTSNSSQRVASISSRVDLPTA